MTPLLAIGSTDPGGWSQPCRIVDEDSEEFKKRRAVCEEMRFRHLTGLDEIATNALVGWRRSLWGFGKKWAEVIPRAPRFVRWVAAMDPRCR